MMHEAGASAGSSRLHVLGLTLALRVGQAAAGQPPIPVIMLTANALPDQVAASRAAGADLHLEKPVTLAG